MKQIHKALPFLFLSAASPSVLAIATANPDTASMLQSDGSVEVDVLANDTSNIDSEADVFIQSFSSMSSNYGSVVLSQNNTLVYTPPSSDFEGTDVFSYTAVDESGYGSSASVTITVSADPGDGGDGGGGSGEGEGEGEGEGDIILPINEFALLAKGARNESIAESIDTLCDQIPVIDEGPGGFGKLTTSEAIDVCLELSEVTDINKTLNEIAPDEALIQRRILIENFRSTSTELHRALAQRRKGNSSSSLSLNGRYIPLSSGAMGGAAGDAMNSPWSLLTSVQYDNFEHPLTENEAGYDYDAAGLMLGLGYQLTNQLNLGAAIDYKNYDAEYHDDGGELSSDLISLNGFISWYQGPLSFDFIAGFTTAETDAQRTFTFPVESFADSEYDSQQINISAQTEWLWQLDSLQVSAFLRLDYFNSAIDEFAETGDSVWLTAAEEQRSKFLNTSLGLDISRAINLSWGVMTPGIRVSLINESDMNEEPIAFELLNSLETNTFSLSADEADDLFYRWDIHSVFVLRNGFSAFISGEVVSGHETFENYTLSAGFNLEF